MTPHSFSALAGEAPLDDRAQTPPQRSPVRRVRRRLGLAAPIAYGSALGPVLLLAVWALGSALGWIDARILPAPWVVATTATDLIAQGKLQRNVTISGLRALEGLAFGIPAGIVVALVSGLSRLGEYLFDGLVQIKKSIPVLALIPLLMLWFGIGEGMKVTVIALSVFVPIYIQFHDALRSIDSRYIELAETLRVSRLDFVRHVILPGSLPGLFLGLRYAMTTSLLALVVVEEINATSGIGYMIDLARSYGQTNVVLVGIVVYAVLGFTADGAVRLLRRLALPWQRTFAG
jgi:sulfonate transport system permease protein